LIVKVAALERVPRVAEILAVVCAVTAVVVMVNVPEVLPAAIVIVAGTLAALPTLDRLTTSPPAGAAVPIVTVPVDGFPPITEAGFKLKPVRSGGLMVKFADTEIPLSFALIVATV
jgi:hypothetical protein